MDEFHSTEKETIIILIAHSRFVEEDEHGS